MLFLLWCVRKLTLSPISILFYDMKVKNETRAKKQDTMCQNSNNQNLSDFMQAQSHTLTHTHSHTHTLLIHCRWLMLRRPPLSLSRSTQRRFRLSTPPSSRPRTSAEKSQCWTTHVRSNGRIGSWRNSWRWAPCFSRRPYRGFGCWWRHTSRFGRAASRQRSVGRRYGSDWAAEALFKHEWWWRIRIRCWLCGGIHHTIWLWREA